MTQPEEPLQPKAHTRGLDVTVASQRRRQIIEAARACISEEGVEKLTLRRVGERAKVSHATIAYYFKTRRELIDSALQEISVDFLDVLRQRHLFYGMGDLVQLVDTFLNPENESARFVVQMIDAGRQDLELRSIHDEFIGYGRDRIERSIRVAMEMGDLRDNIDPVLAAALLHTVLIWWQSELAAGATDRNLAVDVGRLLLQLFEGGDARQFDSSPNGRQGADRVPIRNGRQAHTTGVSTPEAIEASLMNDPNLTPQARHTLSESFKSLYQLAYDLSHTGAEL